MTQLGDGTWLGLARGYARRPLYEIERLLREES
jgi:hypothetical protein